MCEINPKRKKFFRLEFFTSHPMTEEQWEQLLYFRLVELEQAFNQSGEIRVHIHDAEDKE